jgi:FixJ family two-component response regulator
MGGSVRPIKRKTDERVSATIHVVDDDPAFRTALGDLLRACDYRVELHASATDLLERPPGDEHACILLDVQMPGCSGLQLQDRLAALGNSPPIVFVTGYGDIPTAVRAIKAGAEDLLTKPVSPARLIATIERALMHGKRMRERDSRAAALRSILARLTAREKNVFTLLARGKPHKQIAYALGISERTVKFHRHNVLAKFGAGSLGDLVVAAHRLGLLEQPVGLENAPCDASSDAVSARHQMPTGPAGNGLANNRNNSATAPDPLRPTSICRPAWE